MTRSSTIHRTLRCRVGLHTYIKAINDEGARFLVCERCGKESFPSDSAGPTILT